ncbi:MAG: hypothetical protein K9I48_03060 [Sphingobacteriales bacterium]|jgi:hypothetical protein|nr:hypothetical protein [Sphingobacteriales bacterium]
MINEWQINDYHPTSKLWFYTISPAINEHQISAFENELHSFCTQWTAHNKELRSFFRVIENKILILGVDEHLNPASGCSIDKSVHFLEDLEKQFNIELFNRMLFTYIDEHNKLITLNRTAFENAIEEGIIQQNTLVINNLALTVNDWNNNGLLAFADSWMSNFFGVKK